MMASDTWQLQKDTHQVSYLPPSILFSRQLHGKKAELHHEQSSNLHMKLLQPHGLGESEDSCVHL